MPKKIFVHVRTFIKFISLISIATFLIIVALAFFYKPIYNVTINGEQVGYSANKSKLQKQINNYLEKGEGQANVAFVQVESLPQYKICLLKRNIVTNDDEIFEQIKAQGTTYYKYYAILEDNEEKYYISDFQTAENTINQLKEKNSSNISNISILEKYETETKDFATSEQIVAALYKEPVQQKTVISKTNTTRYTAMGSVNTSLKTSGNKVQIGLNLMRPISGTITSRFGARSRIRKSLHTGLDISAPTGTAIKAAESGKVTFSGRKGSFGNMLVITHENGVQTYYAHCSKLYVSAGKKVSKGETIAAVGSTGNSTGPHLHLEVRVNGVAYNPQNYVY